MSYSTDNGEHWATRYNLTQSPSPGCEPGDCDNDSWASLADVVDDDLHIFYLNDKDAGSASVTESPLRYIETLIWRPVEIADVRPPLPEKCRLNQNYPNPFNATTEISFILTERSPVKLEIFDITGKLVETLIDEELTAADYKIKWRADELASGIYFIRLTSRQTYQTRKAVLIR